LLQTYLYQLKITLKRLLLLQIAYFICRQLFLVYNFSFFNELNFISYLKVNFYGLRFDVFSIFVASSLFILCSIIPNNYFFNKTYQKILKYIYLIPNAIFILTNLIDVGYFKFIKKRSTADLFDQVGGQTDLKKLLPQYIADYWWLLIVFVLLIMLLNFFYNKLKTKDENFIKYNLKPISAFSFILLLFLISSSIVVIGIRGGLQRVPIDVINGADVNLPNLIPVTLNTPFTLIKTFDKKSLESYNFYNDSDLNKIYNPIHHFKDSSFKNLNVVVLILESFSKEYTKLGNTGQSYTPFLDSLMDNSLVFSNAFSNGTRSNEGIPAILSSLPSLTDNPLINSLYANNKQHSFANLLKKQGYYSAFMHGGINGTMNFDSYSKIAGYDEYYGKNEYNNNADFDGFWGIYDEPFLQSCILKMNKMKPPFHTAIFTLSSHHPYNIPKQHQNKFKKGTYENHESIGYGDYSLKQFFITAQKTTWFKNTLFIISADHASISSHKFYKTIVGNMSIPILFYKSDNSLKHINYNTMSQIDILPSALQQLGYNKSFFSFGAPVNDTLSRYVYFISNGNYHVLNDSNYYVIQPPKSLFKYNYINDTDLVKPLGFETLKDKQTLNRFNAFIQTYNNTLLKNNIP